GLTESGGCFFLVLSEEILLNRRLLQKKETTAAQWQEEEADEESQRVLREMYQNETGPEPEPIEETRCLSFEEEPKKLILVHEPHDGELEPYPDICPEEGALYIGKIEGEADVLLHSATVSRMHARVTACDDSKCYLKDMNSKNGCSVNGRRLLPHEECEIQEGDTVAFAEIEYHVVKR
ncbi:MAG: FHA domain-containing protein, partial [Lachnospiraceae bacterium]|nr:FHA domain-containing protein [Lachnospiraceae bacterium]